MEIKKLEAAIEAILFTMGNSVELAQIADAIQQDKETTRKILDKYLLQLLPTGGSWHSDHRT